MTDMRVSRGISLMLVNAPNCKFNIDTLLINGIYIPPAAQELSLANVFKVENCKIWNMT